MNGGERIDLFERQTAATDQQIDAIVHKLYGRAEDEIRIVEGAVK